MYSLIKERPALRRRSNACWQVVQSTAATSWFALRHAWEEQVSGWDSPFAVYHTPLWFDLLSDPDVVVDAPPAVAVLRDENNRPQVIVPIEFYRISLVLRLFRNAVIRIPEQKAILLMTGEPASPMTPEALDALICNLAANYPHVSVITVKAILEGGFVWNHLVCSEKIRSKFIVHRHETSNLIHTIPVPRRFDDFLAAYSSKKRYNLRRQHRLLVERAGSVLQLRRVETPDQVADFLGLLKTLASASLPPQLGSRHCRVVPQEITTGFEARIRGLAARGFLRSYVLLAAGRPLAAQVGFQHGDTYVLQKTQHDAAFESCSPGTTLMHMVIEDLTKTRPARLMNLGYGPDCHRFDANYVSLSYITVHLIRKTLDHSLRYGLYDGCRSVRSKLRTLRGRVRRLASATDDGHARKNPIDQDCGF